MRNLYQQHGLKDKCRSYRFYQNLYDYEERLVSIDQGTKKDIQTGEFLPPHQKIFRRYHYSTEQVSYFYRTNEQLVGHCRTPTLIKKNYRLGTRSLQPLNLLELATAQQEKIVWGKPKQNYSADFQEQIITTLLLLCEKVSFVHLPQEQELVPKEWSEAKSSSTCNQSISAHFSSKPLLHFTFDPQNVPLVLKFLNQLDNLAQLDPATEQLIRKVVSAFLTPTQKGECKCHWIEADKTPILMWKSAKDPNVMILKIATQKFLSHTRSDKNGEMYWRFRGVFEEALSDKKQTLVPSSPVAEPKPEEPSQPEVESKEPVNLPHPESSPQVQKFREKYGKPNFSGASSEQPKVQ